MDGGILALVCVFFLITGVGAPPPPPIQEYEPMIDTEGPFGIKSGDAFDDGSFDGVRKVTVMYGSNRGIGIKVQYVAKEEFQIREHGDGGKNEITDEFVLAYPEEFITSISGTINTNQTLRSLMFNTSYGRTSGEYESSNLAYSSNFVLKPAEGHVSKLVGFFGTSDATFIMSLGARFDSPSTCATKKVNTMSEIVPPLGSSNKYGYPFDDGVFDGVRKVTVMGDDKGVRYIRIQYVANGKFTIREHGVFSNIDEEGEFEFEYPQEYIIAINIVFVGSCIDDEVSYWPIQTIEFVTSYARSEKFGRLYSNCTQSATLEPKGGRGPKLVGFLGKSTYSIINIGARFYSESSATKNQSFYYLVGFIVIIVMNF